MRLAIFPYRAKYLGLAFMIIAIPFAYLYFWGGKPDIFNIKTFAFVTTYSETRYFVWSQTNILDELSAVFFISGLSLISFSQERLEQTHYEQFRLKALVRALQVSIIMLCAAFLVVYGVAIFIVCFLIFFFFILIYNALFRFYLFQDSKLKSYCQSRQI
jgi:hypothetical protein